MKQDKSKDAATAEPVSIDIKSAGGMGAKRSNQMAAELEAQLKKEKREEARRKVAAEE